MPTWICLLRGVNLGAHNKLKMAALRQELTAAGLGNVRTYLQSGNVITDTSTTDPDQLAGTVADVLAQRFDLDVPVVIRSPDRLRRLASWCPFRSDAEKNPALVHLLHLVNDPDPERVADLLDHDWGPDQVAVDHDDVAISYATSMHNSRLSHSTALRRLGVDGTARNWRTMQALINHSSQV